MATYTLIESQVLGSAAASVTFSAIPATYTDLSVKISARGSASSGSADHWIDIRIGFNGAGSNVSITNKQLYGLGSAAGSTSATGSSGGAMTANNATASTFSNSDIYIPNYAGSNYKSFSIDNVTEDNQTSALAVLIGGLWSNAAAITSITLYSAIDNFVANSSFNLYGISNTI